MSQAPASRPAQRGWLACAGALSLIQVKYGPQRLRRHPEGCAWRRYSFDHAAVHFLQLSTEHEFSPGSAQYAFLLADLKSVDRSATPWLIVGFHRPFYTDSVYGKLALCPSAFQACR